jgi:hypothetical protein
MKEAIVKRFGMYWRLELANIVIVPATALFLLSELSQNVGWLLWLNVLPNALLLLVGGMYWRAKWLQAQGCGESLSAFLPWAARLKAPLLLITSGASIAWVLTLVGAINAASFGEVIASGVFALLAIAEYVNYYEVQLQHFDHLPDFIRFISGRGFRKSHMKKDLDGMTQKTL